MINFLNGLPDSQCQTINYPVAFSELIKSHRQEIGLSRFSKLQPVLTEMKICNFFKVAVGPLEPSPCIPNYTKKDIEHMILDVNNGAYDRYFR